MRTSQRISTAAAASAVALLFAAPAFAAVDVGLEYASAMGLPYVDVRTIVADVIRAGLGCVGFVLVLQILHGGFKYMVAGGSDDARTAAVDGLKNSIIGFIIVMSASSIAHFVVNAVANAASGNVL